MSKSEFKGLIQVMEDGEIRWFNTDKIRDFLKNHKGERFTFTIKKYRTLDQNAYFHVLVGILGDHLGYELDEMKSIIKKQFLTVESISEKTGLVLPRVQETSELGVVEMNDLIEKLKRWSAQEFSVVLPDPESQQKMEFNK